ncbi:hypothetical protein [Sedimentibacter sp.]|uniref:hypothetical protein n=1 Tax=Sedimentibacter sp. TaxID=1960295 RepID=UPI0028B06674|nr:hypothetical protein [Sedimentibacter sp.]
MNIENISACFNLSRKPTNGMEAYNLLIKSVKKEIKEKKLILQELQEVETRQNFIENWNPNIKKISVYDIQGVD